MAKKGYCVVLATNPLFPPCAVDSRLKWIDLSAQDFRLVTHYRNSSFCKPNLAYYREIFSNIGKTPQQCIMVGNNPVEDMCVGELGTETFLVTDFMENEAGVDITPFRRGSIEELEEFLMSLPDIV
jgi:FMN phosphatase YigB (HAD superfamily)